MKIFYVVGITGTNRFFPMRAIKSGRSKSLSFFPLLVRNNRHWDRRRDTRAARRNRQGSCPVLFALDRGVDPLQEPAHILDLAYRNQFDAVRIVDDLHLLARPDAERFTHLARNDHLELRGNRDRSQVPCLHRSIRCNTISLSTRKRLCCRKQRHKKKNRHDVCRFV